MIRNAWHISGGVGAAANSSNKRVLVTKADGSNYVEEIKNDMGMKNNQNDMIHRLEAQGVNALNISAYGTAGDDSKPPNHYPNRNGHRKNSREAASIVSRLR
jgi:uncharacterized protein (UPF0297 family)